MKILMLSETGDGGGVAHKMVLEGHQVWLWIKDPKAKDVLRGIVDRIDNWRPYLAKCDLVICDMVGFAKYKNLWKSPVFGANEFTDKIELDRIFGQQVLKDAGIGTPPEKTYKNAKDAAKHKWDNDRGYVIKGCGNQDTGKTYVVNDEKLYQWALTTIDPSIEIVVQDVVSDDDSVEVSTEGWFNGDEWIAFNHTFEEKKFMPGDVGKMTGCMGNLVIKAREDKLVQETVMRMTPALKKAGYRGPLDVNCIIKEDKLYALEFTSRLGYDAIEAQIAGMSENIGRLMLDVATGNKKHINMTNDWMIAIRLSRDPFPGAKPDEIEEPDKGMPIVIPEESLRHVLFNDVYKGSNSDDFRYAAYDGIVLKAIATGKSLMTAQNNAYKIIKSIKGVDLQYRNDVGDRVPDEMARLKEWGWLTVNKQAKQAKQTGESKEKEDVGQSAG